MFWLVMRNHALFRHAYVNLMFERGCPKRWKQHEAMVRAVYGF